MRMGHYKDGIVVPNIGDVITIPNDWDNEEYCEECCLPDVVLNNNSDNIKKEKIIIKYDNKESCKKCEDADLYNTRIDNMMCIKCRTECDNAICRYNKLHYRNSYECMPKLIVLNYSNFGNKEEFVVKCASECKFTKCVFNMYHYEAIKGNQKNMCKSCSNDLRKFCRKMNRITSNSEWAFAKCWEEEFLSQREQWMMFRKDHFLKTKYNKESNHPLIPVRMQDIEDAYTESSISDQWD